MNGADDMPTEDEFRQAGFTIDAINFPLSEIGQRWIAISNGIPVESMPRAWRFAPNAYMQRYNEDIGKRISAVLRAERIAEAKRSLEQVKRQCILDAKPEDEWKDGYHQAGLDLEAAFVARITELENPQ